MASVGVIEAPRVQLTKGLVRTIDKTDLAASGGARIFETKCQKVSSRAGRPQGRWRTKEKLTRPRCGRVAGAGAGSHFLSPSRGLCERLKFCAEAKLGKLSDQAICFDYGWTAVEMTGPEIVVFNAVF